MAPRSAQASAEHATHSTPGVCSERAWLYIFSLSSLPAESVRARHLCVLNKHWRRNSDTLAPLPAAPDRGHFPGRAK